MEYNYNYLNNFLKEKFGERTLKICIDGNFTCPNRDGKCGQGGCIFCSERGSGERLDNSLTIEEQVKETLDYKKNRANKFIVYFQNYTNTYASVESLRRKYDAALIDDRIVGLAIATRPDCIDEDIVNLLKEYQEKYYVWVELGLQTANDKTAKIINRGYDTNVYLKAIELLNKNKIDVVTHIMIGLPGESFNDLKNTIDFLNSCNYQGIKIHSTYVVKNTILEQMYKKGDYKALEFEDYMEELIYVITHIPKNIVIHRFSGDSPKDLLVAPEWTLHKKKVMNELNNRMKRENLFQGIYYEKKEN